MALGYSRSEAESIVARNAIASELVCQGLPLERALMTRGAAQNSSVPAYH